MGFQEVPFHPVPGIEGFRINGVRFAAQIEEVREFVSREVASDEYLITFNHSNPLQSISADCDHCPKKPYGDMTDGRSTAISIHLPT